jgi:SAM-dependent methyltransferase
MPSASPVRPSSAETGQTQDARRRRTHCCGLSPSALLAAAWDLIGFPLRAFLLPESWQRRLGLTPLRSERHMRVARWASGRVLDVACGDNDLVHRWLRPAGVPSVGMDRSRGGAEVVGDAAELPFKDGSFRTVTLVAALNHVPRHSRHSALGEAHRVLDSEGHLVVTMIGPVVGKLCHALTWWDPRPTHDPSEEAPGLPLGTVLSLAASEGFRLQRQERFLYGLNAVLLFRRAEATSGAAPGRTGRPEGQETADP